MKQIAHGVAIALLGLSIGGCGVAAPVEGNPIPGTETIVIAGSSTVYPLTLRLSHAMKVAGTPVEFGIANVGTGAGFRAFCASSRVDIVNASRPITADETQTCLDNGRTPVPFQVGYDALAIAVSKKNTFLDALTVEQIAQIFSGSVTRWSDVDPRYPAEPIALFSPGTDSGTFDYFVEVVFAGDETRIATTATTSEDDDVLVRGIEANANAIAYFGYAYYQFNDESLRVIPVKRTSSDPAITPSVATATDRSYPFVRPLFIYADAKMIATRPIVADFVDFYLKNVNIYIRTVGYFEEPQAALVEARRSLARLRVQV